MHDAYEPVPILEKLPLQIDCLAAWGKYHFGSFLFDKYSVSYRLHSLLWVCVSSFAIA